MKNMMDTCQNLTLHSMACNIKRPVYTLLVCIFIMLTFVVQHARAAQEITYAPGQTRTEAVDAAGGVTLTINAYASEPATQSGAITGGAGDVIDVNAGIPNGNPTLNLRGNNTGFTGTANLNGGTLNITDNTNLFGDMDNLKFNSDASPTLINVEANLKQAIINHAVEHTTATELAFNNAAKSLDTIAANVQAYGHLGTLEIAGGAAIAIAGSTITLENGKAGEIRLDSGSALVFSDNGGLAIETDAILMLNAAEDAFVVFNDNTSSFDGGAVSSAGFLAVNNAAFTGNAANENGGAMANTADGTALMYNVEFSHNQALGATGGGAINNAGVLSISNGNFLGNEAVTGSGGAIFNGENAVLNLEDISFNSNNAANRGGALFISLNGVANLNRVMFINNTAIDPAGSVAGAAYVDTGATVNIATAIFSANTAKEAGAIYNAGTLNISNAAFNDNQAVTGFGGAIYNAAGGSLSINSVAFNVNTTNSHGGAIYNAGTLTINNVHFNLNTAGGATTNGGAIYNTVGNYTVNISNSVFRGNETGQHGGAIYNNAGVDLKVENVSFNYNSSMGHGGAIHNNGGSVEIDNAVFMSNTAHGISIDATSSLGYGGAIYNTGGNVTVRNSIFKNNYAGNDPAMRVFGGAIYTADGTLLVEDSIFSGNGYNGEGKMISGGAIQVNGPAVIRNSSFYNNSTWSDNGSSAGNGGAIHGGGTLDIYDSSFVGNYTQNGGIGGVMLYNGLVNIHVTKGSSLISGNMSNGNPYGIIVSNNSAIQVHTAENTVLDMRDPIHGRNSYMNMPHTFEKFGAGVWKMGGAGTYSASNTEYIISEGTLYFYRAGEVANANYLNADATVQSAVMNLTGTAITVDGVTYAPSFTLKSGARLIAGGGNAINATHGSIVIESGATLGFDVGAASMNTPILTLNAATVNIANGGKINIDLMSLNPNGGTYKLASSNSGDFTNKSGLLTLRGERAIDTRYKSASIAASAGTLALWQPNLISRITYWSGGNIWNASSNANWSTNNGGAADIQFLHGDIVNFNGQAASGPININAGGVQVAGMYVSGNTNYAFTGGAILSEGSFGSSFTGQAGASGKLILGATVSNAGTINTNTAFTGLVDFSGMGGGNEFRGGVDIYGGTLLISSASQLGTDFSTLGFKTMASQGLINAIVDYWEAREAYNAANGSTAANKNRLDQARASFYQAIEGDFAGNVGTLQIKSGSDVNIDGLGRDNQRLVFEQTRLARINLEENALLKFQNSITTKDGGVFAIDKGAFLELNAADDAQIIFNNNAAERGGAIYLKGAAFIDNALFENNISNTSGGAVNFGGVLSLSDAVFNKNIAGTKGGAINVDEKAAVLNLNRAGFTGNTAMDNGGAISGTGTFNIIDSNFIDNESFGMGGAIYAESAVINLNVTTGTMTFRGNIETDDNGFSNTAGIYLRGGELPETQLNVNTAQDAVLDMRDSLRGASAPVAGTNLSQFGDVAINKSGGGVWKLAGDANFSVDNPLNNKITFNVNEGVLHLYRYGEVENPNSYDLTKRVDTGKITLAGGLSSFNLKAGATLKLGGGNAITIADGSINFADGSTVGFDLLNADGDYTGLALTANAFNIDDGTAGNAKLNFAVGVSNWHSGTFTLIDAAGYDFSNTDYNNAVVTVENAPTDDARFRTFLHVDSAVTNELLLTIYYGSAVVTWTGDAGTNKWNTADGNWNSDSYLNLLNFFTGDAVNFDGNGIIPAQGIELAAGGVVASAMYISGDKDYKFTGDGITTDQNASVNLNSPAINGKLFLGAKATGDGVLFYPSAFNGILDFTGITGTNNFTEGVEFYNGTLKISHARQLGYNLSNVRFMGEGGYTPTLVIAGDADFSGANSRLNLEEGYKGTINITAGTLTMGGVNVANTLGGAIYVAQNGVLTITAAVDAKAVFANNGASISLGKGGAIYIDQDAGLIFNTPAGSTATDIFTFSNNSSNYGGAIASWSDLSLSNATFTNNVSVGSGGSGGAIAGNDGMLTLNYINFTDNMAAADGGAIISSSNAVNIANSVFNDNTAGNDGGAIHNIAGNLVITDSSFIKNTATVGKGGAISSTDGTVELNVTQGRHVFTGNTAGGVSNAVALTALEADGSKTVLKVNTAANTVLDMRDALSGVFIAGSGNGLIEVTKTGAGTWYLGGNSVFANSRDTNAATFSVNAGTLHLYAYDEVSGDDYGVYDAVAAGTIALQGVNSKFTLAGGAILSLGGGNAISTAGEIGFAAGSVLDFGLGDYSQRTESEANTVLSLSAGTFAIAADNKLNFTLNLSSWQAGQFTLIDAAGYDFGLLSNLNSSNITYAGSDNLRRYAVLSGAGSQLILNTGDSRNYIMIWDATTDNTWDSATANWNEISGLDLHAFANGDVVNFNGAEAAYGKNITMANGIIAGAIYVSGNKDYAFINAAGGITTDAAAVTQLTGNAVSGKLVLGAQAAATGVIDATASFSGVLDLTGTVANSFKSGVDIYSGTLKISNAGQLGGNLSNLNFLGAGNAAPTLEIAGNTTFSGQSGRLSITAGYKGFINVTAGTLAMGGLSSGVVDSGSIYLDENSMLTITAATGAKVIFADNGQTSNPVSAIYIKDNAAAVFKGSDGSTATGAFTFSNNRSNYGGAIASWGNLSLSNATFIGNNGSLNGGAIINGNGGELELNYVDFSSNIAGKGGGAIHNANGILNVTHGSFSDNTTFSGWGGAISNVSLGNLSVAGATFNSNSAVSAGGAGDLTWGGAIFGLMSTTNVEDAVFYGNNADRGGAIAVALGTLDINAKNGKTVVFAGNQNTTGLNSIHLAGGNGGDTILNVNITAVNDAVYMLDAMSGSAGGDSITGFGDLGVGDIEINKTGAGVWKLAGNNVFTSATGAGDVLGSTAFNVNGGTLYLYAAGEKEAVGPQGADVTAQAGSIQLNGAGSSFSVNNGGTLALGGGNTVSLTNGGSFTVAAGAALTLYDTGNSLSAGGLSIAANAALGFNLANYTAGSTTAALQMASSGVLNIDNGAKLNFDIDLLTWKPGTFILLDINNYDFSDLTSLSGTALNYEKIGRRYAELAAQGSKLVLTTSDNGNIVITWTGADTEAGLVWNDTAKNWSDGDKADLFVDKDTVVFAGAGTGEISIDAGGVTVSGMRVTAGSYTFNGGDIIGVTDRVGAFTPTGKLELSTSGTTTLNVAANFAHGTTISNGRLALSHGEALGVFAVNTVNSADLRGQLAVIGNAALTLSEDVDELAIANRILVDGDYVLTLAIAEDKTLTIRGINNTNASDFGGAFKLLNGGSLAIAVNSGHLVIENNTAENGAALYAAGNNVIDLDFRGLQSLTIKNNNTLNNNWAVTVSADGNGNNAALRMGDNVAVNGNSSGNYGVFYINSANADAILSFGDNAHITNNQNASAAIQVSGGETGGVTFGTGAIIFDNRAMDELSGYGGAINASTHVTLNGNTLLSDNRAALSGGAIYMAGKADTPGVLTLNASGGDIAFAGNLSNFDLDGETGKPIDGTGKANAVSLHQNITVAISGAGNVYFDDPITCDPTDMTTSSNNSLTKTGAGFVQFTGNSVLNNDNNAGGAVTVNEGAFRVVSGASFKTGGSDGKLFTVNSGGLLGGGGEIISKNGFLIKGFIRADSDRFEIPRNLGEADAEQGRTHVGPASAVGTLTLTGDVTLDGATLIIDLVRDPDLEVYTSDLLIINGNVAFTENQNTVDIGLWAVGTFTIGKALSVDDVTGKFKVTVDGESLNDRQTATLGLADGGKLLQVTTSVTNLALTWDGADNAAWDYEAANWSGTTDRKFIANDYVIFTAAKAGTVNVDLAHEIQTSGMEITGGDYIFTGGDIIGTTGASGTDPLLNKGILAVNGGSATFSAGLYFKNGITINQQAAMILLDGVALPNNNTIVNNGALTFNLANNLETRLNISGQGTLTKLGDGVLTLNGNSAHTGGTLISGGKLVVTNAQIGNVTNNNAALEFSINANAAYNGVVSGSGGLAITGMGANDVFTLSRAQLYTGATVINLAGELNVTIENALAESSGLTLTGGYITTTQNQSLQALTTAADTSVDMGAADLEVAGASVIEGTLSNAGNVELAELTLGDTGTITNVEDLTLTTGIVGGTLGNIGGLIADDLTLSENGAISDIETIQVAATANIGDAVSDVGSFTAGTLILDDNGSINRADSVTVTSGTVNGFLSEIDSFSIADGSIAKNALNDVATLTKTGAADDDLVMGGNTVNALSVTGGSLTITGGETLAVTDTAEFAADTILNLTAGTVAFTAANLNLGSNLIINIDGFDAGSYNTPVVLIRSANAITGSFTYGIGGDSGRDYMSAQVTFADDARKEIVAVVGLTWNDVTFADGEYTKAHGNFTVKDNDFTINVVLKDRSGVFASGWDGVSLTKAGDKTLTIAAVQEYSGMTKINDGVVVLAVEDAVKAGAGVNLTKGSLKSEADQTLQLLTTAGDTAVDMGGHDLAVEDSSSIGGTLSNAGLLALAGLLLGADGTISNIDTLTMADGDISGTLSNIGSLSANELTLAAGGDISDVDTIAVTTTAAINAAVSGDEAFSAKSLMLNADGSLSGFTAVSVENGTVNGALNNIGSLSIAAGAIAVNKLNNVGLLEKNGTVTDALAIGGNRVGGLAVKNGILTIAGGETLVVDNSAGFSTGTVLSLTAGTTALTAKNIDLGANLTINVSGFNSAYSGTPLVLISSQNAIAGAFTYTIDGAGTRDYLTTQVTKTNEDKDIVALLSLAWNDMTMESGIFTKAHGTFTLTENDDTLSVALSDRDGTFGKGWDGKKLTKDGSKTLTISVAQNYSGITVIKNGALALAGTGSIAKSEGLTIESGLFDISQLSSGTALQNINGVGKINLGANTLSVNAGAYGGEIYGTGGLTKTGASKLTLSAGQSYTGQTAIAGGELSLTAQNVLADSAGVALNGGKLTAVSSQIFKALVTAKDTQVTLGKADLTVNGATVLAGALSGVDNLTLQDLDVEATGSISDVTDMSLANGTLAGSIANVQTIAATGLKVSGSLANIGNLNLGAGALSGKLQNIGSLTKTGADGLLTINSALTLTGGITVQGGTLAVNNTVTAGGDLKITGGALNVSVLGGGPVLSVNSLYFAKETKLNISGFSGAEFGTFVTVIESATEIKDSDVPWDYILGNGNAVDYLTAQLRKRADNLALEAAVDLTWYDRHMTGGIYDKAHGTFTLEKASDSFELDVALAGREGSFKNWDGQSLIKDGQGTLTLLQANTYKGSTTVKDGTLALKDGGSIAESNGLTLDDATFDIAAIDDATAVQKLYGSGVVNLGAKQLDIGEGAFSGIITGDDNSVLAKTGEGLLVLSGANTYSGVTVIENGILKLQGLGTVNASSRLAITSGIFDFSDILADGIAVTALNGAGKVVMGAKDFSAGRGEFAGVMEGSGNFTKTGAGTFSLKAQQAYSGKTVINGGILELQAADALKLGSGMEINAGMLKAGAGQSLAALSILSSGNIDMQGHDLIVTGEINTAGTIVNAGILTVSHGFISNVPTNTGSLLKTGDGTLNISESFALKDDLTLQSGALILGGPVTVGNKLTVNGGSLGLNVYDDDIPAVTAKGVSFAAGSVVNLAGYSGSVYGESIIIIQSDSVIEGDEPGYVIGGGLNTDYLSAQLRKSADETAIVAIVELSWYDRHMTGGIYDKAHGTFTLENADDDFELGAVLVDREGVFASGWQGDTLTKAGEGHLSLMAENTYSGGTLVSGGTLSLFNAKAAGTGAITNNAVVNLNFTGTLANDLLGSGTFEKLNEETVISYTGDGGKFSGIFNIGAGALLVNGNLGGIVNVKANAVLGGAGTIYGKVNVAGDGVLSPGNSIGTLIIDGDLTLAAGAFLDVELMPDGSGGDLLEIKGTAAINGAIVRHIGLEGEYSPLGAWTILKADKIEGEFAEFLSPYEMLKFAFDYQEGSIIVKIDRDKDFGDYAENGNQKEVADALESLGPDDDLYNKVIKVPEGTDISEMLAQLSGELHVSVLGNVQNYDRAFGGALRKRAGAYQTGNYPLWVSFDGYAAETDKTHNSAKTRYTGAGISLGAEAALSDSFMLGAAFRYSDNELKINRQIKADIKSYSLGLYGKWDMARFESGMLRLTVGGTYGLHTVDSSRRVKALGETLKADYNAQSAQVFAELGYKMQPFTEFSIEPYMGVAWNSVWTENFHEKGGLAALKGQSNHQGNVSSTLGVRFETRPAENLSLKADLSWQHVYGDVKPEGKFAFKNSSVFTSVGAPITRDALGVNLSGELKLTDKTSLQLGYEGLLGDKYQSHGGYIKVNITF